MLTSQLGQYPGHHTSLGRLWVEQIMEPNDSITFSPGKRACELAIRIKSWFRKSSNELLQVEAEALTLGRIIHRNFLTHKSMIDAIESCPWMETALRRLYGILYVESRPGVNWAAAWSIAKNILEVYPETGLHVPSLEGSMAREAALRVKELSALESLGKRGAKESVKTRITGRRIWKSDATGS